MPGRDGSGAEVKPPRRVVVTSLGDDLLSPVDPRFGRAAQLLLVDLETGAVEVALDNAASTGAQGAGLRAAEAAARLGADCILTGHCGPKAFRALQAAGIQVFTGAQGTVANALELFRRGELQAADDADVAGHWA